MRSLLCTALVGMSTVSALGQSIEFRIRERFNDTVVDVADAAPTGGPNVIGNANDKTLWFVVQARVTGLNPAAFNGLGGFAASIVMTAGAGNGSYKASGSAGVGGTPTNNSPVNFFPIGTSSNGFATGGVAHYEPYRLISNLGAGGDGTRLTPTTGNLTSIFSATGGAALERLSSGELTAAVWGVDTWINVYAFQYDVLSFVHQTMTWTTNFNATYFTTQDAGVPNSIPFESQTQGSYIVPAIPAPSGAAMLVVSGLIATRRRRL